jgi:hypothetical protein
MLGGSSPGANVFFMPYSKRDLLDYNQKCTTCALCKKQSINYISICTHRMSTFSENPRPRWSLLSNTEDPPAGSNSRQ